MLLGGGGDRTGERAGQAHALQGVLFFEDLPGSKHMALLLQANQCVGCGCQGWVKHGTSCIKRVMQQRAVQGTQFRVQ